MLATALSAVLNGLARAVGEWILGQLT